MKRYTLYILVAILGMLNIQPASAQEVQDALYIFRNDGGFNAFFFADIQRIEYSKIDTLGVEQNDYVVQEVYALDSCFRIPISAIDSVAFVTPKTVYKADVVQYDKNIADYIVASDSVNWFRLATNTPTSLIPKKDEKLLIESASTYLPYGTAGLVESVEQSSDGYTVNLGEIDARDLYERVVIKAGAGGMPEGASAARGQTRAIEDGIQHDPIHWGAITGSVALQGSRDLIDKVVKGTEVSVTADVVGSINYNIDVTTTFRFFYYCDIWSLNFTYYERDDYVNSLTSTIGGGVSARLQCPLKGTAKEVDGVIISLSAGIFVEGSGTINTNFTRESKESSIINFGYTEDWLDGNVLGTITADEARVITTSEKTKTTSLTGKGSLGVGFYAGAKVKLKYEKVNMELSAGVDIGIRDDFDHDIDYAQLSAEPILRTTAFYRMANADDIVTITGFANIHGTGKIGKYSCTLKPEIGLGRALKYGIVPNITNTKWVAEEKTPWRGKLTSEIGRRVIFDKEIGYAVFDEKDNKIENYWAPYLYGGEDSFRKYEQTFDHFNPGKKYFGYAQTTLFKFPVLVKKVEFSLGYPFIKPEKNKFDFDEAYNSADIEVITNIANVEFKESESWISKPTWLPQTPSLLFDCDPLPDNVNIRKGKITAVGRDWDGNIIKEDSINITQRRGILKVTPANLEFDKKGGTQKVTIETTYDNVEVVKGSEYTYPLPFEMSLNASKTELTVTVPENTTGDSRRAAIIVSATTQEGKKISEAIYLYQSAEEDSPYYITFDKTNVEVGKDADTYEFTSECNFLWEYYTRNYRFEVNGDDQHRWLNFKQVGYSMDGDKCIDKWNLTVEKNDWDFDRKAVIDILVYDKDSTKVAKNQITIVQKGNDTQEGTVFPTKFDEASLIFSGKFKHTNHHKDEDKDEKWEYEYVDGIQVNVKDLIVSSTKNGLHFSGTYSEEENGKYGYDKYIHNYSKQFSLSIKNITGLKENTGLNWKGNYFEGSYIDHISASFKASTEWVRGNYHDLSSAESNFSSSANVSAGAYGEDPWNRWHWTWESNEISHSEFSYFQEEIREFYRPDVNDHIVKELSHSYDWTPIPGEKYTIAFTAVGYLPEEASSRTRGALEKQIATSTERITRHIER